MNLLTKDKRVNYRRLGIGYMSNIFDVELWEICVADFLKCYEIWGFLQIQVSGDVTLCCWAVVLNFLEECTAFICKDRAIQEEFSNSLLHLVKSFTFLGILHYCNEENKSCEPHRH